MSVARAWWLAFRPKTLPAALAPIAIGTVLAYGESAAHWPSVFFASMSALFIQIGTNLANDYFDFRKGADTSERIGPMRATQAGLLRPETMRTGFVVAFLVAVLFGLALIARGGWPILLIGLSGIAAGILYTGGPRPLGYVGLGDLFVLLYFGPIAVAGTHYVQTLRWSEAAVVAGLAPGLLSTALLAVNNLRDVETDRRAGKQTLAARFGRRFAKGEYLFCIAGAALVPALLITRNGAPAGVLAASAVCLLALPALRHVIAAAPGDPLIGAFQGTGRLLSLYGIAFVVGWFV